MDYKVVTAPLEKVVMYPCLWAFFYFCETGELLPQCY